jgi:hypothetical protein
LSVTHSLARPLTQSLPTVLPHWLTHPPTHSLIYSLARSLIHSLSNLLPYTLTQSPTHSAIQTLAHSFPHPLTPHSLTYSLPQSHTHDHSTTTNSLALFLPHPLYNTDSPTQPPTPSYTHSLTQALTHSLPHSPTHSPSQSYLIRIGTVAQSVQGAQLISNELCWVLLPASTVHDHRQALTISG